MADTAPAAPQILPYGIALPEQSSTQGGSTTAPTPFGATPSQPLGIETAPRADQTQAGQDIVKATEAQGAANVGASQATVEGARHAASQALEDRFEAEALEKRQAAIAADARARKLDLQDKVKNFKFNDWYDTASVGNRVLAAIASGLLSGGTGQYHNVAQDMAESQHKRQLDKLSHLEKQLTEAGADESEVDKFGQEARANLTALHAQRLNAIAAETQAMAAKYNTPGAKAAADLATANAKAAAAKADIDADAGLRAAVGKQHSETKNTNAKAATTTEPAEKGAEAQVFGTAVDTVSHGFVTLPRRQVEAAEKAAREVLSKTKTTEHGEEQVQELLGAGSPIEGLTSPGQRAYARGLVHSATVLGNKNKLPPAQALETLMPRSDATPEANARALKNLHDVQDSMTPAKTVRLKNGQRGVLVNGKVVVQ